MRFMAMAMALWAYPDRLSRNKLFLQTTRGATGLSPSKRRLRASEEMEPKDAAPVQILLTISATGSTCTAPPITAASAPPR